MLKISNNGANEKIIIHLDKYSKILLSLIASCLVLIVTNIYFSPNDANALQQVQDVNLKSINGYSISGSNMPVDIQKIEGSSGRNLSVDLKSINGRSVWGDKIPVDIQGINGQFIVGGELPVKIK
ncbi:MAG: hypothetical protein L0Y79_01975 [Chlorobi bacterium]|nr:hypothetical protein [Chlorobiota bacterium]MCI0714843.1 hypothetical protein [Chlorobiota bacterium]